jgi:phosphoribosylformylglycinamidine cyclo-ligase
MVALTAADDADAAIALLAEHDVDAWVAGEVAEAASDSERGVVRLVGEHA